MQFVDMLAKQKPGKRCILYLTDLIEKLAKDAARDAIEKVPSNHSSTANLK